MIVCLILLAIVLAAFLGFVAGINLLCLDHVVYGRIFTDDSFREIRRWIFRRA